MRRFISVLSEGIVLGKLEKTELKKSKERDKTHMTENSQ